MVDVKKIVLSDPRGLFGPRPIVLNRTITGAGDNIETLTGIQGYFQDIMAIVVATGSRTVRIWNGSKLLHSTQGTDQIVARAINLESSKFARIKVEISPVPASWTYDLFVTHGRITGE